MNDILLALREAGAKVKGRKVWCPFHEDKHSSGGIYPGRDGRWRYHCFVCRWNRGRSDGTAEDVWRAIGSAPPGNVRRAPPGRAECHDRPSARPDFDAIYAAYPADGLIDLAASLRLTMGAVTGMGYRSAGRNVWGLPVYGSDGTMTGIQLRGAAGRKWCVPGTRQGLFVPQIQAERFRTPLCVTEGASDAAYILGCGLPVVGRFAAKQPPGVLIGWLKKQSCRDVIVIADTGQVGVESAQVVVKALRRARYRADLLIPPAKDIRTWAPGTVALRQVLRPLSPQ